MFPVPTFHLTGPCDFEVSGTERMRRSVSAFMDSRDHWQAQHQREELIPETPSHEF